MGATVSPLRVLVVDDSAFNRKIISDALGNVKGVGYIDFAGDGAEALRQIDKATPDFITLDLEMPRLDGFKFLKLLMTSNPIPVVVISGHASEENVFRALELGAIDFIEKSQRKDDQQNAWLQRQLSDKIRMVRALASSTLERVAETISACPSKRPAPWTEREFKSPSSVFVLGASTGGPTAITQIVSKLPRQTDVAVVVAQHMPQRFTQTFAARLHALGGIEVTEATNNELLQAGKAYICPGGHCIELGGTMRSPIVRTFKPYNSDRYVPSVDRLFESAAQIMGENLIGVVLTGMGDDGALGVRHIKERGGIVLIEDPNTAVVFGMPESAEKVGVADQVLPLPELSDFIQNLVAFMT